MKTTSDVTKNYLMQAPLPTHGGRYSVIPHTDVIRNVVKTINNNGFEIERELYRSSLDAQVATGIYHIKSNLDDEMSMMFAWVNSYNKTKRFRCAVGSYVTVCMNGMISGDLKSYGRKHTGSADVEYSQVIKDQLSQLSKHHKQLVNDKNSMKEITVSKKRQAELLGQLFISENIITSTQLSEVKEQMVKPSYDYGTPEDSLWTLYNHVTHAVKGTHPSLWIDRLKDIHTFFTQEYASYMRPQATDTVVHQGGMFSL